MTQGSKGGVRIDVKSSAHLQQWFIQSNELTPYGSLITIIYEGGSEGYFETRTVQEGFLTINPENSGIGSSCVEHTKPAARRDPAFNEDSIICKIVGGLTPLIEETVAKGLEN
ncbi:unnamed protein product [Lepeophtheirus salmonis]|uniref:(salmon louse) hypothetical protein n=1 Tax=Lepeophtheirus salmonis TaxID=72036 RepID=A0A7R8CWR7_LEPSM|nr:unnamed protein product [Lepeophtheirus salmonis]CAF2955498.1 unnamed protein product [Lepeophtheirus salmonis]